jgi:hypothetical protein
MKKTRKKSVKQNGGGGLLTSIRTFSLSRKLKDQVELLQREKDAVLFELGKSDRKHKLLERKNKGILAIEHKFFNGEIRFTQDKLTRALREEISRLNDIVSSQQEIIEKTPFDSHDLHALRVPEFTASKNPVKLIRNYHRYRSELKEYHAELNTDKVEDVHFVLSKDENGVTIERDGTKAYKSDFIKEHKSHIEVGAKLRRYYYLADIPAYLSPYVFFRLLTSGLPFTLSVFMQPASSGELLKKARQRLSVLEMQQNDRLKDGKIRDQQTDKNMEEVMSFIDELVHESEKGVIYSLYLQLEADSEKELESLHKNLQNTAEAMDIVFNQYTFGQKKAFKNFLPFNTDHVKENRILQSTAAAYLMPFVSKQLNDPDGIFLGINAFNNSLVFTDPFTSRNNNMNIFGVSGSGKSVTSKILMNRLYMRGTQIIVIDPEGEYVDLARNLGGEVIQFSRENGINPFYINSSKENDILDHISTLKTFFRFFIPEAHYDGALLDEKLIKLYDESSPSFENLLELLGDHPMRKDLAVLSEGSLRGVFNSTRKLELNNDIIVLDLQHLKKDEKRDPAIYLLTSLIWNLVNRGGGRRRMLFIDEAHKLLVDKDVAVFYRELVKQARKRNVGVVSITQDVEDFLNNEYGKAIITNSETKILLKQSYATLKEIGTIYPMTDQEKEQLGHLEIGEVVLFREGEHIRLNVHVLPHEQPLVFTSPAGHENDQEHQED